MTPEAPEFVEFPKIARLSRECIVTEKIDGTNACVFIGEDANTVSMRFGSRTRWITLADDNFGFARWGMEHAEELLKLGPGRHFGEWWGNGIQRGYGLPKGDKRFSLFNTVRWVLHGQTPQPITSVGGTVGTKMQDVLPACCGLVPVLGRGKLDYLDADTFLGQLRHNGSVASPGFMRPEGIVIFHIAGNIGFKKTIEKDDLPKGFSK